MVKEISKNMRAINVTLEEKKCATMKTTIELIQTKLRAMFGMQAAGDENMAQE